MKKETSSIHALPITDMTKEGLLVSDMVSSIISYVEKTVTNKEEVVKVTEFVTREFLEIRPSLNESETPAWRENHFSDYSNMKRDELTLGYMTDLEMANSLFMLGDRGLPANYFRDMMSPIAFLTAGKERIRWLSIHLEESKKAIEELKAKVATMLTPPKAIGGPITDNKPLVVALGHPKACGEAITYSGHNPISDGHSPVRLNPEIPSLNGAHAAGSSGGGELIYHDIVHGTRPDTSTWPTDIKGWAGGFSKGIGIEYSTDIAAGEVPGESMMAEGGFPDIKQFAENIASAAEYALGIHPAVSNFGQRPWISDPPPGYIGLSCLNPDHGGKTPPPSPNNAGGGGLSPSSFIPPLTFASGANDPRTPTAGKEAILLCQRNHVDGEHF